MELMTLTINLFCAVNRASHPRWGKAPHKPVLLLAILHEIEELRICENLVPITPNLAASFRAWWSVLVPPDTWTENMYLPFRHLTAEGWWTLMCGEQTVDAESIEKTSTLKQLASLTDGGRFKDDLWLDLRETNERRALRRFVLSYYFDLKNASEDPKSLPRMNPVEETTRLLVEALQEIGSPAHYREIFETLSAMTTLAESINEKKIKALMDRVRDVFVHFDRGVYALTEWGVQDRRVYAHSESGYIGDHIETFLVNRDKPALVDDVVDYVISQKPCRELSILQRLAVDERFYAFGKSSYGLKRWVA